ncbi:MAG: VCBS repeat-containing protein [Sediminicola sp.]
MTKYYTYVLLSLLFLACQKKEGALFSNPSPEQTGISFSNTVTPTENLNILDYLYFYNGGGVALGDIDNDGLVDIFFSGNQVSNKLYLNKGGLKFEDISTKAGIEGNSSWNTGAIMGDVNGDGLLDIYVCAVVGINGFNGFNELYINNGNATFTESAAKYGLDFDSYSSSAVFFDYDLDGDLDLYLLNHAVHTQDSYGKADTRLKRNYQTGDKLMRNDGDRFIDVSEEAGIYGGANGYGLGIAVADFNQDGYPDIYVGNDFHEDDYYYLNNGDGTFTESLKKYFGHTTRFSMGNDVADINHDGWPDILSLDMLSEDEKVIKSSVGDENLQIQNLRIQEFGYHYQYTRNMLQINQSNGSFTETALMSGIAATDWSWSALFGDYDQDGEQDIFISNGIPKRPNDLDFINFVSNDQIKKKINNTKLVDNKALKMMPSGAVHNYIYKGNNDLTFKEMSGNWIAKDTLFSGATAMGDLDNDGDLDLVINNGNAPASLYINKTDGKANYVKIQFDYSQKNRFGIGTKVFSYHQGTMQYRELHTVRGFQASSEPMIHFGYGTVDRIDSIRVVWPDRTSQVLRDVATNQTLKLSPKNTTSFDYRTLLPKTAPLFGKVEDNLGIDYVHTEDAYIDYNRQKLIPYQISDRGPATAIGDLDDDGRDDIFFGGSKFKPSQIYVQTDSSFVLKKIRNIYNDSIKEDVDALIRDFDQNGKNDLFIGSGGGDFYNTMKPLLDSYYLQKDSIYEEAVFPDYFENASVVRANDYDKDGDLDLFVGAHAVSNDFGKIPRSHLLNNDGGRFSLVANEQLQNVGMVTDAIWVDFDNDGTEDLIVVGEWMSPTFFKNDDGQLLPVDRLDKQLSGLWQSMVPFDIDSDGDTDILLGNWGTNTKFKATDDFPMKMYYSDFDGNGSTETIVTTEKNGEYYPLDGLDELAGQLVSLRKKFNSYKTFAGQPIEDILDKKSLDNATLLEVNTLQSGYLRNNKGHFTFVPFPNKLQVAPITAFLEHDFDGDGKKEVLAGGNYFGVKPYHGRFDAFSGALIKSGSEILMGHELGLDLTKKSVRHLNIVQLNNKSYLLVTFNNEKALVYELFNSLGVSPRNIQRKKP